MISHQKQGNSKIFCGERVVFSVAFAEKGEIRKIRVGDYKRSSEIWRIKDIFSGKSCFWGKSVFATKFRQLQRNLTLGILEFFIGSSRIFLFFRVATLSAIICTCNCKYDNLYSTVISKLLLRCFTTLLKKLSKLGPKCQIPTAKSLCSV